MYIYSNDMKAYFYRYSDNEIFFNGIDFGPHPTIIWEEDGKAIFRVKGSERWSGLGQTRYYPTAYYLMKITKEEGQRLELGQIIARSNPEYYWRASLKDLKEIASEL